MERRCNFFQDGNCIIYQGLQRDYPPSREFQLAYCDRNSDQCPAYSSFLARVEEVFGTHPESAHP